MKLRLLVCSFAFTVPFLVASSAAHAQAGVYFNPIVSRITNGTADTGPFAFLGAGNTSAIFGGVDFGGYYNFLHAPGFDAGIDVRDEIQHSNGAALNSFMVGPRVAAKPMVYGLAPYAQISFGSGRSQSPKSPVHITKLEYVVAAGVDKSLNRHVDFRVIEIGYGSVTTVSSQVYGGTLAVPAAKLLNFSTGFVFHIP